jgi:hypothetical protein
MENSPLHNCEYERQQFFDILRPNGTGQQANLSNHRHLHVRTISQKRMTYAIEDARVDNGSVRRGIQKERDPRRISPVQVNETKEIPMGSIEIGLADLLQIFAALFGGSSEPEA